ncbi:hypothetical protein VTO42DRAFT_5813 [Malbranchea cinnamomea]
MDLVPQILPRLYSEPPATQTRQDMNPTLLVSWWATAFSLAIIFVRLVGRYIRTERLFPEDWVMALSVVPLLIRMAFIHVVLLYGTNNTETEGFTDTDIRQRELGSRLVLGARIFYALFIWTAKFTVAEFLRRLTAQIWRRSFQHVLQVIRYFLGITFIAVIIATLTECQPFSHYWQVVPDPGPKCRQGYAQLITMGTCDIITDLLLVAFPIPIIHLSAMPLKRRISLSLLFALSLILVAITAYRVPSVIHRNGSQQYRSLLASLEILAAAAVSNAVVIGSFVRDRGVKKQKFKVGKLGSVSESVEHASVRRATITHHHWGSDADLAVDLGIRLDPKLYPPVYQQIRPAPPAPPSRTMAVRRGSIDPNWRFSYGKSATDDDCPSTNDSLGGARIHPHEYLVTNTHNSPHKHHSTAAGPSSHVSPSDISFNDVGGLLGPSEPPEGPSPRTTMYSTAESRAGPHSNPKEPSRSRTIFRTVSGLLSSSNGSSERSSRTGSSQSRPRNYSRPTVTPVMTGGRLSGRQDDLALGLSPLGQGPPDVVPELQDAGGLLTRDLPNHINPMSRECHPQSEDRQ